MMRNISITLITVMVVACLFRVGSMERKHPLTYDETVYSVLAAQIMKNPANYNTKVLYADALKQGRKLPEYFNKPLFKHPPVFPGAITLSYRLFGEGYLSAFKVSLLFGILLIPLAYLLGRTLFGGTVGAYAAALMSIEPISWICSQKIWCETTLAFFTILSITLFIMASKKYNIYLILASGIAAGFAVLTKYPGILATFFILAYTVVFDRQLFKKKSFIVSLFLPFVMLLPWIDWNYQVYGAEFTTRSAEISHILAKSKEMFFSYWGVLVVAGAAIAGYWYLKKKESGYDARIKKIARFSIDILSGGILVVLFASLGGYILRGLNINIMPGTSWQVGSFAKEPWFFYFGRIMELSPLYIFSYLCIFLVALEKKLTKEYSFLFIVAFGLLCFYSVWGNFQCRYITAVTVPMMVLSAKAQIYVWEQIKMIKKEQVRSMAYFAAVAIAVYLFLTTFRVDMILAYPNTACYF